MSAIASALLETLTRLLPASSDVQLYSFRVVLPNKLLHIRLDKLSGELRCTSTVQTCRYISGVGSCGSSTGHISVIQMTVWQAIQEGVYFFKKNPSYYHVLF